MTSVAFVFDIDGVLYRVQPGGKMPIPGALEALELVRARGCPHQFVSNGTGETEAQKAKTLVKMFGLDIEGERVILASTSMARCAAGKRKLVVAHRSSVAHAIAKAYGWDDYITLQAFARHHVHLNPCKNYAEFDRDAAAEPGEMFGEGARDADHVSAEDLARPIEAIMVLENPTDWHEGVQIVVDVARSTGFCDAAHLVQPDHDQIVEVHFGNPDLDFATSHSVPRMTLGAFRVCCEALFKATTGRDLQRTLHGKPYEQTFATAERKVDEFAHALGKEVTDIYMIGDNPISDIRGANMAGGRWHSVLVRTGCFQGGDNDPVHPAQFVFEDVRTAVTTLLARHGL